MTGGVSVRDVDVSLSFRCAPGRFDRVAHEREDDDCGSSDCDRQCIPRQCGRLRTFTGLEPC